MRVRSAIVFLVTVLGALSWSAALAQTGFVQVRAEPGIQVFLDDVFVGVTSTDVGGLILLDVAAGQRRLRFVHEGFVPQEATVGVVAGQVLLYEVGSFVPQVEVTQEGAEGAAELRVATGTLVVQCLPIECVVDIPLLGIAGVRKTQDRLVARGVPEGSYTGRLSVGSSDLPVTFGVCGDDTVTVFGTFVGQAPGVAVTSASNVVWPACEVAPVAPAAVEHWPDPIAHYRFENAADIGEDAARGRNAETYGAATLVDGIVGKALRLDGSSVYLRRDSLLDGAKLPAYTHVGWFYLDALPARPAPAAYQVFSNETSDGQFGLGIDADGVFRPFHHDGAGWLHVPGPRLEARRWYFFAVTWDGARITAYLDGDEVGSLPAATMQSARQARGMGIGTLTYWLDRGLHGGGLFGGALDELRVFDRTLDAPTIRALFAAESRGMLAPLAPGTPVPVAPAPAADSAGGYLQVGTFADESASGPLHEQLAALGLPIRVIGEDGLTKLLVGPFDDASLDEVRQLLADRGIESFAR